MAASVHQPTLRRRLVVATAIVSALGLAVELWAWRDLDEPIVGALWPRLSLSVEANVPTWFASSLLLCCALAAGSIAGRMKYGERGRRHWWGIAIALGWVS